MFHHISIERLGTGLRYDTHLARRLFGSLIFTFLVTVSIAAQTPAKIDVMRLGPQIGQAGRHSYKVINVRLDPNRCDGAPGSISGVGSRTP
jgi:hypothetical protein